MLRRYGHDDLPEDGGRRTEDLDEHENARGWHYGRVTPRAADGGMYIANE